MISFIKTPKQMTPSVLSEDKIVVTLGGNGDWEWGGGDF